MWSKPDPSSRDPQPSTDADVFALLESAGNECGDSRILQALLVVARQWRSQAFSPSAAGVDLVYAALCAYFPGRGKTPGAAGWRGLAASIAASIARDPESMERLERLWLLLCRRADEQDAAEKTTRSD